MSSDAQESSSADTTPVLLTIASVESPDLVRLSDGRQVRLLGVRTYAPRAAETLAVLRRLTTNERVFVRNDKILFDSSGTELVYLYLENGLFINALLVKHNLVDVEDDIPFKYLERFSKKHAENNSEPP